MTIDQFDRIRETLSTYREGIIQSKRPEYTQGQADVLANFKIIAGEMNLTPLQVWFVYFRKHVASIIQFCKDPTIQLSEPLQGRVADCMNYLELFLAIAREMKEE